VIKLADFGCSKKLEVCVANVVLPRVCVIAACLCFITVLCLRVPPVL
jgi:hypothetical protein